MLRYALTAVLLLSSSLACAKTPSEVYEQAAKSTVVVRNIDSSGKAKGMGSGVILPDRDVVTNCHVVKGASQLKVLIGKQEYPAILRFSDWDRDVCSLSVPGISAPSVVVGSTKTLKVGAKVYAIGAPKGLELTLSDGIVSSLREVSGGQYIQTTAAISPGSSGGGLFDENGSLVGLTTFYLAEGQSLNFAVPVEWVKELQKRSTKTIPTSQTTTQWVNRWIELLGNEDWTALLEHSQRWTKAQPGSDQAWAFLGAAYAKFNQSAKAIEAYQQALRINPKNSEAWTLLGFAYIATKQFTKAIETSQQALRINLENADAWYISGTAYEKVNQPAKAIEAYQQALRINPEDALTWDALGSVYDDSKQFAKAIEAYQQALRINPEYAKAWKHLGIAHYGAKQLNEAIEAFQQSLRINPKDARTWALLGFAYEDASQSTKAIEAYQQALRISPEYPEVWAGLGDSYQHSGQSAKAIETYQKALHINPKYSYVWRALAIAYASIGQSAKAIEASRQADQIPWFPTN